MLNKIALSAVVATIMLVLLTIVAVTIVASFIIPLVRKGLEEGTECFPYRDYFSFEEEFGYNCYNASSSNRLYAISVRAGPITDEEEAKVKGFKLAFLSTGESITASVEQGFPALSSQGSIRMLDSSLDSLEIPKNGEVRTYVYNAQNAQSFTSVEIFPLLNSGKLCEETDSVRLDNCDPAKYLG